MSIAKILQTITLVSFFAFIVPAQSNAATATPTDSSADSRIAVQIVQRVNEIQGMDKSNLTTGEKKALRKELKEMNQKATGLNSTVYISLGAIIIIILLLVLILR